MKKDDKKPVELISDEAKKHAESVRKLLDEIESLKDTVPLGFKFNRDEANER